LKNSHKLIVNPIKVVFISIAVFLNTVAAYAQVNCIKVDQIDKWEVLDNNKIIVYDNQGGNIAFVIFDSISPAPSLKKNDETFRFFSSTICRFDRVQISNGMTMITSIEPIRK